MKVQGPLADLYTLVKGVFNTNKKSARHVDEENIFLHTLQNDHRDIWEWAFVNNCILCIPQSLSLNPNLSRDDIETHVAFQTKRPGIYETKNGKFVSILGNELVTVEGFETPRRVRIVVTEDVLHDRNYDLSLMGIHISRPLVGGVAAPDAVDEMDRATVKKYIAILRAFPENEVVFREMDALIKQANFVGNNAHDGFDRVTPSLRIAVGTVWARCVDMLRETASFDADRSAPAVANSAVSRRHQVQVENVVESYLMEGMHSTVYPWMKIKYARSDLRLADILHKMRFHTQADLGLRAAFQCPLPAAIREVALLPVAVTPLEKLLCLKRVSAAITRAVEESLEQHYRDLGDFQMTTDDLLDQTLYVLLQAYPHSQTLLSDIRFIKMFHFISISTTGLGYTLANFEVAAEWFMARLKGNRRRSMDENDAQMLGAGEERRVLPCLPSIAVIACDMNVRSLRSMPPPPPPCGRRRWWRSLPIHDEREEEGGGRGGGGAGTATHIPWGGGGG